MSEYSINELQSDALALRVIKQLRPGTPPAAMYRSAAHVAAHARQAVVFTTSAAAADVTLQPLLRYYALLQWMKSLLYVFDPAYPPTTSVLQHGLSVRRAKRDTYRWTTDSLYAYKEGVLQSFAAMSGAASPLPARLVIGDLLGCLPAMAHAMDAFLPQSRHVYRIERNPAGAQDGWYVSRAAATHRKLTVAEWRAAYAARAGEGARATGRPGAAEESRATGPAVAEGARAGGRPAEADRESDAGQAAAKAYGDPTGWLRLPGSPTDHPWLATGPDGTLWLYEDDHPPMWMVHFALLYSLGALCRYNALEWSDIVLWNNEVDAYLVRAYLGCPWDPAALFGDVVRMIEAGLTVRE